MRNPWLEPAIPGEHGRVVIHVGLRSELFGRTFSRGRLFRLVRKLTEGSSVVPQVGVTRAWGREPSAQVVLVNGGYWTIPWAKFLDAAKAVAAELGERLGQVEVLLETFSPRGAYQAEVYLRQSEWDRRARAKRATPARRKWGLSANRGSRVRA